jgi:hypothetical protein
MLHLQEDIPEEGMLGNALPPHFRMVVGEVQCSGGGPEALAHEGHDLLGQAAEADVGLHHVQEYPGQSSLMPGGRGGRLQLMPDHPEAGLVFGPFRVDPAFCQIENVPKKGKGLRGLLHALGNVGLQAQNG